MIDFLVSINKISLIAFFITFSFLIYEIVLLKKESQSTLKKNKINLPRFEEGLNNNPLNVKTIPTINKKSETKITKPNNLIIIVLIIICVLFGLITIIGFVNLEEKNNQAENILTPTPIIEFVNSKGIKIFDENFNLIPENNLNKIKQGEKIFIGIETIPEVNIDRARIKVNKKNWDESDITLNFSKKFNVFYKEYQIATDTLSLKIDAQLHSQEDGWLGE